MKAYMEKGINTKLLFMLKVDSLLFWMQTVPGYALLKKNTLVA